MSNYCLIGAGRPGIRTVNRFYEILNQSYGIKPDGSIQQSNSKQKVDLGILSKFYQEKQISKSGKVIYQPQVLYLDSDVSSQCQILFSKLGNLYDTQKIIIEEVCNRSSCGVINHFDISHITEKFKQAKRKFDECTFGENTCIVSLAPVGGFGGSFSKWMKSDQYFRQENAKNSSLSLVNIPNFQTDQFVSPIDILNFNLSFDPNSTEMNYFYSNSNIENSMSSKSLDMLRGKFSIDDDDQYSTVDLMVGLNLYDFTAPFRNQCLTNQSIRKLGINMIPFPRFNCLLGKYFISDFHSDWVNSGLDQFPVNSREEKLIINAFQKENSLNNNDIWNTPQIITGCFQIIGQINQHSMIENLTLRKQQKLESTNHIGQWIPDSIYCNFIQNDQLITNKPENKSDGIRSLFIATSSQSSQIFQDFYNRYKIIHQKKAYLHHFTNRGYDELEIIQCAENLDQFGREQLDFLNYFEIEEENIDQEDIPQV